MTGILFAAAADLTMLSTELKQFCSCSQHPASQLAFWQFLLCFVLPNITSITLVSPLHHTHKQPPAAPTPLAPQPLVLLLLRPHTLQLAGQMLRTLAPLCRLMLRCCI